MKTLLRTLLAVAVLAAPFALHAQSYGVVTVISGGTNNVAATATNTYTLPVMNLRQDEQIGVAISFKMPVAGNSNCTVRFARSLNGTTWETTPSLVVTATTTNFVTNLTFGATGYLRPATVENVNIVALTNVTVSYSIKPANR
jgi:hypothetical protein